MGIAHVTPLICNSPPRLDLSVGPLGSPCTIQLAFTFVLNTPSHALLLGSFENMDSYSVKEFKLWNPIIFVSPTIEAFDLTR